MSDLGMFGHHPDKRIDYECEIDALIGMAYDRLTGMTDNDIEQRIAKAMMFRTIDTPLELRWLNKRFNGVNELYFKRPDWVTWPENA